MRSEQDGINVLWVGKVLLLFLMSMTENSEIERFA